MTIAVLTRSAGIGLVPAYGAIIPDERHRAHDPRDGGFRGPPVDPLNVNISRIMVNGYLEIFTSIQTLRPDFFETILVRSN